MGRNGRAKTEAEVGAITMLVGVSQALLLGWKSMRVSTSHGVLLWVGLQRNRSTPSQAWPALCVAGD